MESIGLIMWFEQDAGVTSPVDATFVPSIQMKMVEDGTFRTRTLQQADFSMGKVTENTVLTFPGAPVKRHLGEILTPLSIV